MNKILVAIDGSDHAWKALDLAAELAKAHGARLLVLHVVPYEPVSEALRAFAAAENIPLEEARGRFHEARTLGNRLTRRAEAIARDKGVEVVESRTAEGSPADEILAMAKAESVDMVVLGTRGLSRPKAVFLGSVSHKVAPLPTARLIGEKAAGLIVRPGGREAGSRVSSSRCRLGAWR